jgi:phosphoenolpyruvate carboxykinase (ATP)
MASKPTSEFYANLKEMSPVRALAETVLLNPKVRKVTVREAYELALKQPGVSVTDMEVYPALAEKYGLPKGARVINDCHGKIIGRTAKARRFYNRISVDERNKIEGDMREALYQMEQYELIRGEAVLGMDPDLMIKAHFVTTVSDAANLYNWLINFIPYDLVREQYDNSRPLPVQDIILLSFNEWTCGSDPYYHNVGAPTLALVDEKHNVIFNLGMRYFGERKKGTLTLAWTSGMRMNMAACHGGIKEIDFTECQDAGYHKLGKRSIAFYGLSGTGKSSHTNSHTNGDTLPAGFKKAVLHDDAFQIDNEEKVCRVWEPTLFDKTDNRDLSHPDWKYCVSVMNHALVKVGDKILPLGLDIRQSNGRALLDRDLLGAWVNRCAFPSAMVWLMKDIVLPPAVKFTDKFLAVAMGAALMTRRSRAENVTEAELKQLVFEPFANPFRVYELWRDVEAFIKVIENGAEVFTFNSGGFWKTSESDLEGIKLQTSLTLQTKILTSEIEWEDWPMLPGAQIPTKASIDRFLPDFYEKYSPYNRQNSEQYMELVADHFAQRRNFLANSDIKTKPELLDKLISVLNLK